MKRNRRTAALLWAMMLTCGAVHAQDNQRRPKALGPSEEMLRAEVIMPRPALRPVKSLTDERTVVDTIDTGCDYIKIILYSDKTWRYAKTDEAAMNADVFNEYWNTSVTDPYRKKLEDLPISWTMWVADSLAQYHVPYPGGIYPRGKFGLRRGRRHTGVDLPLKTGENVYAAFDGKVRVSCSMGGYGNLVVIRHECGLETFYGHLSKRNVQAGDWVHAGDVIGLGGSTGRSTGPHLHFEVRYDGFAFDPEWLIDFSTGDLRHQLFVLKRKFFTATSNFDQDFESEMLNDEEDRKEDAERAAMRYYTVKAGDNLSSIARRNGTTVANLCKMNGISASSTLKIGKVLRVK